MTSPSDTRPDKAATSTAPNDIQFESLLEAPPAKVWRALTIPDYVAAWLSPDAAKDAVGSSEQPELLDCRVLSCEAPRTLRYAWSEKLEGRILDSIVTFELAPRGQGATLLRVTQGDFVLRPIAANLNQPTMLLRAA